MTGQYIFPSLINNRCGAGVFFGPFREKPYIYLSGYGMNGFGRSYINLYYIRVVLAIFGMRCSMNTNSKDTNKAL